MVHNLLGRSANDVLKGDVDTSFQSTNLGVKNL